ncbi:myogenesis-regulating glycosidase isoform X3 [Cimex lectularius]|uniref:Family 31 glucosidase KIAA1161 n=1 Tax=Cimex lectularius TaxID=79782 RepID=A0A8I6RPX8_CIMLE|nr:myogenesis-regulating glycosidase isoform X2 [Cimex lectularius]XP_014249265.1 myogenesis-regulating glycosidase isoform X3 [Cimex lectularius]
MLTPESARHDGYETSDTFSDGGISDAESSIPEMEARKLPLTPGRNARKKSVMPGLHSLSKTDVDDNRSDITDLDDHSPGNSITSVNSISSLLKEKLLMTFPRALKRRKKPKEYKLRVFVTMLFFAIVFLVTFAHIFYHQQVLQRAYFEKIRFNKEERIVRLYNNEGVEIALGYLGVDLRGDDRVHQCLPQDQKKDIVCLEWMHRARLYLSYSQMEIKGQKGDFRCYRFTWESLHPNTQLTDCFENGKQHGHWYGGGRTLGMAWPVELGQVEMSAFVTGHIGRHRWGSVLKRYFINSRGVAISVDSETPLYVSINAERETRLCLQARQDDFAYVTHKGLPKLNYSVCTSSNMKLLHSFLSEKSLWDGLTKSDAEAINSLVYEPVWQIAPRDKLLLTQSAIANYTDSVNDLGFLRQGYVLLNEHWQVHVGDLTLDKERFPTMEETIDIIHRRGFRIALTIQPFISTESKNFAVAVEKGLLITERGSEQLRKVPALTRYKSVSSAGMLDVTNNETIPWMHAQLTDLLEKYKVDSFYLDMGTAYDMPQYYQLKQNLTNPDLYKTLFTNKMSNRIRVLGVSGAISRPPAPVFVSLPTLSSTWESLQVIIPTILTYGIVGYPFLMPGPVGGDYLPSYDQDGSNITFRGLGIGDHKVSDSHLPNKELYIRWLQLATFLPVIRYSHLPSDYVSDNQVLEQAKVLTALRLQTVNPLLNKLILEALNTGVPLIRPLWMLDPSDSACHLVVDEFSVGDELIVAPILSKGTFEREVYLPAGVWKDGIDGSLRKGSRWLHSYKVPGDKIAYFVKMPDNTRF